MFSFFNMSLDIFLYYIYGSVFWLALALGMALIVMRGVPEQFRFLGTTTSAVLVIYGLSEFADKYVGDLVYPNEGVFIIKTLCVLTLAFALGRYVYMQTSPYLETH